MDRRTVPRAGAGRAGPDPARDNARALPTSALEWIVDGHVGAGPTQMIGMLDYTHGRLVWDIRNRVSVPS